MFEEQLECWIFFLPDMFESPAGVYCSNNWMALIPSTFCKEQWSKQCAFVVDTLRAAKIKFKEKLYFPSNFGVVSGSFRERVIVCSQVLLGIHIQELSSGEVITSFCGWYLRTES